MTVVLQSEVMGGAEFHRAIADRLADAMDEVEASGHTEHESFDAEIKLGDESWVPVTVFHLTDIVARGTGHHCGQPDPDTGYPLARITAISFDNCRRAAHRRRRCLRAGLWAGSGCPPTPRRCIPPHMAPTTRKSCVTPALTRLATISPNLMDAARDVPRPGPRT